MSPCTCLVLELEDVDLLADCGDEVSVDGGDGGDGPLLLLVVHSLDLVLGQRLAGLGDHLDHVVYPDVTPVSQRVKSLNNVNNMYQLLTYSFQTI